MTNERPLSEVSDLVGTEVRKRRTGQRLTVEELATRCAEAGAPHLTTAVLYDVEAGRKDKATGRRRRTISVDELLVLAHVLDVKPDALIVPPEIDDTEMYRLTPTLTATAGGVRRWLRGEQPAYRMFVADTHVTMKGAAEGHVSWEGAAEGAAAVLRDPALLAELARAVRELDRKEADDA